MLNLVVHTLFSNHLLLWVSNITV